MQIISELNGQVALLRQMLIIIGQPKDSPEHREKIRRLRRQCVDACKHVTQLLLPQIHRCTIAFFSGIFVWLSAAFHGLMLRHDRSTVRFVHPPISDAFINDYFL